MDNYSLLLKIAIVGRWALGYAIFDDSRLTRNRRVQQMKGWIFSGLTAADLAAASLLPAQSPAIWAPSTSLVRISPNEKPSRGTMARVYAARGETQSFQVAINAQAGDLRHRLPPT